MSQTGENKKLETDITRSLVGPLIISAICQIITGVLLYVLGTIALLIRYDVLYWPPFMNFSLGNLMIWQILGYFIVGFSLFQLIYAILIRIKSNSEQIRVGIYPIAIIQLLFVPVGTICAGLELNVLKSLKNHQDLSAIENKIEEKTHQETGKIQIWAGLIHEAFLSLIFLLTVYLSTMMLDLTYPFLTMQVLIYIRWGVLCLGIIFLGQIITGWVYITHWNQPIVRILAGIFAILQILMLPIGTMACISTLRDIHQTKDGK